MPTYVYRREDGTTFEIQQRITEPALEVDPETGQKVKRIISGSAGLIFKGDGFYLTDYARKNGGKTSDAKGSDGKAEKASDGATKETKAETQSADASTKKTSKAD